MYYKIERTYLTDESGNSARSTDRLPHMISAASAETAVEAFLSREQARLLGGISHLPGDKAAATALDRSRVWVVFVERASDSIRDASRMPSDDDDTARRPR